MRPQRIQIAGTGSAAFVGVFGLFGVGGLAIGLMLAIGAHKIAVASPGTSENGFRFLGILALVVSGLILTWTYRQMTSIRAIEIGEGGTWTLITRTNRRSTVTPSRAVLDLHGFNVWLSWNLLPRRINVCTARLTLDGRSWRLVQIEPSAYDDVLRAFEIDEKAPRKGRARYELRLAA